MKNVIVVVDWIRLQGGVSRSLMEILRRIDSREYHVTLWVLNPSPEDRDHVPNHVSIMHVPGTEIAYLGFRDQLRQQIRAGRVFKALVLLGMGTCARLMRSSARRQAQAASLIPGPPGRYDIAMAYAMLDALCHTVVAKRVEATTRVMWSHIEPQMYPEAQMSSMASVFANFDVVNCVSESTRLAFASAFPSLEPRTRVRRTLLNEESIRLQSEAFDPERKAEFELCTVARITPEKGIDLLVEVARQLLEAGIDFHWRVVGPVYDEEFANEIGERIRKFGLDNAVELVGGQSNPYPFMRAADILVHPARFEGTPLVWGEALTLGTPIVSTSAGGANERFEDRVEGSIVAADADAIYHEVKRLIEDPLSLSSYREAISRRGESGPERVGQNYLELDPS